MATKVVQESPRDAGVSIYSGLPRLALPRERARVVARHFRRSIIRLLTLLAADIATLALVVWVRQLAPWGHVPLVDAPLAVLLGLMLVGSYGRGEIWRAMRRVFGGVGLGVLAAGWAGVTSDPVRSTLLLLFIWLGTASVMCIERWALSVAVRFAKARFLTPERLLVVGAHEPTLESLRAQVATREGVKVVGMELLSGKDSEIWQVLQDTRPDTVVIAGDLLPPVFSNVVRASAMLGCYVLSVSRYDRLGGLHPRVVWWAGTPFVELSLPELTAPQLAVKRAVDVVGSLLGLIILSPLFLLIALFIKGTSAGPALFKQIRVGFGGNLFWMYKFRTMQADADDIKQSLAHLNASGDPRLFKIPDDPRVTKVGRFLRRWSLDEFPQLINVLKGEMSLVGPRPFFEDDLEDYRDEHFSRLAAKPGLTGLWQVRGRSSILDFDEVVRLDLEYVFRWSLLRDLLILLETIPAVLRRAGAA